MSADEKGRIADDGGMSSLIPYRNARALTGYYLSFLALIPAVGVILGPIAVILGIMGIAYASKHPDAKGTGHGAHRARLVVVDPVHEVSAKCWSC
jgi:hypothetical protein